MISVLAIIRLPESHGVVDAKKFSTSRLLESTAPRFRSNFPPQVLIKFPQRARLEVVNLIDTSLSRLWHVSLLVTILRHRVLTTGKTLKEVRFKGNEISSMSGTFELD
jgi:hypothetical protein